MSSSSDSKNSSTSYKPFAISNYSNNDDELYSARLSSIDEEIIKTTSLLQLKEKLFNLPHNAKSSLVYAQQVTDIVNDDHLLGFLYVENYNVDVSVQFFLDGRIEHVCCVESFYCNCKSNVYFLCLSVLLKSQHIACTNEIVTILEYSTQGIW